MEIRELQPGYAVSPQIEVTDMAALAAAGFRTIINNRPDSENPFERQSDPMRLAAEAAGLTYVFNPIVSGALSEANVAAQRAAIDASDGPVFAYCASGRRSAVIWAMALAGRLPPDELIAAAERWGYQLDPYRAQLEALASG